MNHDDIEARIARLDLRIAQTDAQLAITRQAVARLEARAAVADAGIAHLSGRITDVTADANGRDVAYVPAVPALPWTMADDGSRWTAQLPDGRTAKIERLLGEDGLGGSAVLPWVGDAPGPVCNGVLAAAQWCAEYAAGVI